MQANRINSRPQKEETSLAANEAIEKGGVSAVLGTISKLASNLRNERVEYRVEGHVDLKDVVFDPNDVKEIYVT